jgi:signal transduction histidine kinase/ligand-binding sensor domain-containing protein
LDSFPKDILVLNGGASRLLSPWAAALAVALLVASPDRAQEGYSSQSWTVDEGLPHNNVQRLVQDRRGYLWVASAAGLARFDGLSFKEFPLEQASATSSYNMRDLVEDANGALLMLPASGGVISWRDNAFSRHPVSDSLAGKVLLGLFAETGGALWVTTGDDQELVRWEQGRIVAFRRGNGLPARLGRISFAADARGKLWVACGDFLGFYDAGRLTWLKEAVGGRNILLAPARSGGIWVSSSAGLMKFDNDQRTAVLTAAEWQASDLASVQQLFEDRQGTLWIGTRRRGLFYLSPKGLAPFAVSDDAITAITQDRESNIWVATNGGGIVRLRPKTYLLLDAAQGLADSVSTSICEDESGALWCANRSGGLVRSSAGHTEHFGLTGGSSLFVNIVHPDRAGNIWVAASNGLYTISSSAPKSLVPVAKDLGDIHVLFCSARGEMWVSSGDSGIGCFRGGVYSDYSGSEGGPKKRIRAIAEDASGAIWIATGGRDLFQLVEGKFVERFSGRTVPGGIVNTLVIGKGDSFWLGTSSGLVLKQGDRFQRFGVNEGLSDEMISQILEDDSNRLWCATRRGLSTIALDELHAVAERRLARVTEVTVGKDEGLIKASALAGVAPMAWKTRRGRLWFSTNGGLVGIDPAASFTPRPTPPVYIDEVEVDDNQVNPAGPLHLKAGDHQVAFKLSAVNFSAPEKVRVRHQLMGFDSDWSEPGHDRIVRYAHLPPGNYEMHVTARNQDGPWAEPGAMFAFVIPPAWWQTWLFRASSGLGLVAAFGWSVRYWSHRRLRLRLQNLERENQLERERARIARDLHDEIGASVTKISLIADRLRFDSANSVRQEDLEEMAARTRRLSGELEGVVWTVSPKNDNWNRLASFVRQYALNFFTDSPIACTVEGVAEAPETPLAPETQHHLLSIVKEALNNILKHSRAHRVSITLTFAGSEAVVRVLDDGAGFDPEAAGHGERNGLTNMRGRAREIGGSLQINSAPGRGTELVLSLPTEAGIKPRSLPVPPTRR